MVRREEIVEQGDVSRKPCLGENRAAQKRYRENVRKVTGPMVTHPDYGEIFLLQPDEVPHSTLFLFDVNKFWFIELKDSKKAKKMTVRPFIHNLRGYWFSV